MTWLPTLPCSTWRPDVSTALEDITGILHPGVSGKASVFTVKRNDSVFTCLLPFAFPLVPKTWAECPSSCHFTIGRKSHTKDRGVEKIIPQNSYLQTTCHTGKKYIYIIYIILFYIYIPGQGTKIPYTTTKPCTAAKTQRSQNK